MLVDCKMVLGMMPSIATGDIDDPALMNSKDRPERIDAIGPGNVSQRQRESQASRIQKLMHVGNMALYSVVCYVLKISVFVV